MANGGKTWALIILGVLAMLGLNVGLYASWYSAASDWNTAHLIISTMRDVVVLVLGYLAGASTPTDILRYSKKAESTRADIPKTLTETKAHLNE